MDHHTTGVGGYIYSSSTMTILKTSRKRAALRIGILNLTTVVVAGGVVAAGALGGGTGSIGPPATGAGVGGSGAGQPSTSGAAQSGSGGPSPAAYAVVGHPTEPATTPAPQL